MALDDNPWIGMLTQPQSNCTANIISYFTSQGKMLSDASGGKIQGMFARTYDVNRSLSPIVSMEDLALGAAQVIEKFGTVHRTPDVVLLDADDMYKVKISVLKLGQIGIASDCLPSFLALFILLL